MSIARYFRSVSFLVLCSSLPAVWLACGGGSKPPETPADESSSSSAGSESDGSAPSSAAADSASAAPAAEKPEKPEATATAEASPPPAPTFGSTDCSACIDKVCAKAETACGKNTDCQAAIDSIHACTSPGAASCISGATAPTDAKPKKLAAAVTGCEKKAIAGKTCKAKCQ
ncbi:MAG TPA: hypothetical protein VK841_11645 [Polyangiaceae bacterium]|nr:hypothetical protein [Polyangiaceae bacterium]